MYKFLVSFLLLFSVIYGKENISVDFLAFSQHFEDKFTYQNEKYDYNAKHNYFGINYQFENKLLPDNFFNEVGFSTFKNSYFDRTYILGYNLGYNFYKTNIFNDYSFEFGAQAAIGLQKGYCNYAESKCEGNESDISIFAVPSIYTNFEKLKLSYFVMPGVCGVRIGMKVFEW